MIHNMRLIAVIILIGLIAPSAALAEPACYDAKVRAQPIDQVPSEIGDCGADCFIMSWPWFVDLRVKDVVDGVLPIKVVRVLTVQHTYRVSRARTWLLRRNTAGSYNVLVPEGGAALARCSAEVAPVEPYIGPSDGHTLDDLRDAGIRRYGHHTN
ncbi:hypothetical protein [Rhizorhabdus sp.]|jgi:hypothetical protein|uniref:hypothetical protein n=1 Tax=Rhizorhabdus sp. TaxID=1968843 RepID=UPI001996469F|nr:hypothetical protein [Rhizorhabdus sp.]MBD3762107.1 hypothetical protein [Rhizorhabdus sp.]